MNSSEIRQQISSVQGAMSASQALVHTLSISALDSTARVRPQDVSNELATIRMCELQLTELQSRLQAAEIDELQRQYADERAVEWQIHAQMQPLADEIGALGKEWEKIPEGELMRDAQVKSATLFARAKYNVLEGERNTHARIADNVRDELRKRGQVMA